MQKTVSLSKSVGNQTLNPAVSDSYCLRMWEEIFRGIDSQCTCMEAYTTRRTHLKTRATIQNSSSLFGKYDI